MTTPQKSLFLGIGMVDGIFVNRGSTNIKKYCHFSVTISEIGKSPNKLFLA